MRRSICLILIFALVFSVVATNTFFVQAQEKTETEGTIISNVTVEDDFEPGTVIVVLKKHATVINKRHSPDSFSGVQIESIEDLSEITNEEAMTWIDRENYRQILKLTLKDKTKQGVIDAIRQLEKNENVRKAIPNYRYTLCSSETEPASTYPDEYTSTTVPYAHSKIKLPQAWDITTGNSTVYVGILDTGINPTHPDLAGNLDTSLGESFATDGSDNWHDALGHGTHVAGIIGAVGNNGFGVAGVCWQVKMVSLKVYNTYYYDGDEVVVDCGGTLEMVCNAIQHATNMKISILNYSGGNSWIGTCNIEEVIANYPGLVVTAAGNRGKNLDDEGTRWYPTEFDLDNIISVASTDNNDQLASFSNYGEINVDLAAPGVDIHSTTVNNGYITDSGTSFAAPFVAGTAALIKSIRPDLTSREIRDIILSSVDVIPALEGKVATGGRLNVYAALQMAQDYAKRGELLSGDFDGDGTDEVAAFFQEKEDGENSVMTLRVWESTDTRYDSLSGEQWGSVSLYGYDAIAGRMAVGDFNGDGYDDVATLCDRGLQTDGTYTTWLVLWRSRGDVRRSTAVTTAMMTDFAADRFTDRVAAGDFNGDGCCDLIGFCNQERYNMELMVGWVWQGNANMNFPYAIRVEFSLDADNITGRVTAGDYNGDGCEDVVVLYDYGVQANGQSRMMMLWWRGSTSGSMSSFAPYSDNDFDANTIVGVVSGDFNGDGYDDILALYDYTPGVEDVASMLWLSQGANAYSFVAADACLCTQFNPSNVEGGLISGDFDGDGDVEARVLVRNGCVTSVWQYTCIPSLNLFNVSAVWYQY